MIERTQSGCCRGSSCTWQVCSHRFEVLSAEADAFTMDLPANFPVERFSVTGQWYANCSAAVGGYCLGRVPMTAIWDLRISQNSSHILTACLHGGDGFWHCSR
eukprot:3320531-Amphidinium_carterae.1